jgi:circadian clock protein KaiC
MSKKTSGKTMPAKGKGQEERGKAAKGAWLKRSKTGISELDAVLGGGFLEGAVVLVSGNSGTGKTILSLEWLFNGANKFNENGVYITFTEPLFKTLRSLEGMAFYKRSVIEGEKIKILDIRKEFGKSAFREEKVLSFIENEVRKNGAKRLVIDSITAISYSLEDKARIRKFIFDLGTMLATLGCTTILTSEVSGDGYSVYGVEEFIADGILLLKRKKTGFQVVRTLEIAKMRGIEFQQGANAFRITTRGIKMFPSFAVPLTYIAGQSKVSVGVKGIDDMANGGLFEGSSSLLAGSTGTGKSVLGFQFIWTGLTREQPCLLVAFEESRDQIIRNAKSFGWDFEKYEKSGLLKIMCAYPHEKYMEEHLLDIKRAVEKGKVKRCVVDSLSAIGSSFETEQFRYFTRKLNALLKHKSVTSLFTVATRGLMAVERLTEAHLSTMTDNILLLKFVELGGEMRLMGSVLKTRGDDHSKSLREYRITSKGIVVGEAFKGYESIMAGFARKIGRTVEEKLRDEFVRTLGPMGEQVFAEQKKKGLTKDNLIGFVDSSVEDGIIKVEDGEKFKERIKEIMGG